MITCFYKQYTGIQINTRKRLSMYNVIKILLFFIILFILSCSITYKVLNVKYNDMSNNDSSHSVIIIIDNAEDTLKK
jgi:hypothetical protein